jgi:hypothetical protein
MTLNGHGVGTSHIFLDLNMPVSGADGIWPTAQVFMKTPITFDLNCGLL